MNDKNGILILMPTLFIGGSELQVRYIIEGLEAAGKKVVVLVENGSASDEQNMQYVSAHKDVEFVFLEQHTFEQSEKNVKNKLKSIFCIATWIIKNTRKKHLKWTMYTNLTGLLTVPICRIMGIKVLFNERNPGVKMCDNIVKRTCLKMCNKIVANSRSAAEYMGKCLNREVACINNGVKLRESIVSEVSAEKNIILVPARITRIKNQIVVAKAMKEIVGTMDLKVLFAGQPEEVDYVEEVQQYIKENQLEDRITFLGYVKNIQELYDRASLVVLPSFEEGTPNVMLEAYLNKKLCLASNIIMNQHATCDERILFEADNEVDLAEKIQWILNLDEENQWDMIERNYNYVLDNYSLKKMQDKYIRIFNM